jgi:hypothetical protein
MLPALEPFERTFAKDSTVTDTIQRHASWRQRFSAPVSRCRVLVSRSITSSVTSWIERARSISRCVSNVPGFCGGPPNRSSNFPFVMVRAGAAVKVVDLQPEGSIVFQIDQMTVDRLHVLGGFA